MPGTIMAVSEEVSEKEEERVECEDMAAEQMRDARKKAEKMGERKLNSRMLDAGNDVGGKPLPNDVPIGSTARAAFELPLWAG